MTWMCLKSKRFLLKFTSLPNSIQSKLTSASIDIKYQCENLAKPQSSSNHYIGRVLSKASIFLFKYLNERKSVQITVVSAFNPNDVIRSGALYRWAQKSGDFHQNDNVTWNAAKIQYVGAAHELGEHFDFLQTWNNRCWFVCVDNSQ